MENEFSVVTFFADDSYVYVARWITAQDAVRVVSREMHSPRARFGKVKRIIITDGGDCCVFEWKHGEGVVFPPRPTESCPTTGS